MGLGYALSRGLPGRRPGPPHQHDPAQPGHHPAQGHAAGRGDPGRVAPAQLALRHQGRGRDRPGPHRRRGGRRPPRPRRRVAVAPADVGDASGPHRARREYRTQNGVGRERDDPGAGLRPPPPVLGAGPGDAGAAADADDVPGDPRAGLVAAGRGPRPRHASPGRPGWARWRRWRSGCTAIVDHHESPNAIEGSLSVIADACAEVGVRVVCAYGVTDRHGADGARPGAGGERALPGRRRPGDGRAPRRLHLLGRHDRGRGRPGRRARRGGARPRGRGARRRRRRRAAGAVRDRRLAAGPRRAPARRPRPGRDDRPQPPVEHEQRRGLRPPGPVRQPGRAGHRRHRRRHARGVPPGLRPPAGERRDRHPRDAVVLAGGGPAAGARGRATTGSPGRYPTVDPWSLAFTTGVPPGRGRGRRRGRAGPTVGRRGSTATRSGPRRPRPPGGCGPGWTRDRPAGALPAGRPPASARASRSASYAEAQGFEAVWQAESRLVREATVPMAAFLSHTDDPQGRLGRGQQLDPQPRPAGVDLRHPRRPRPGPGHPRHRGVVGPAGGQGRHRPVPARCGPCGRRSRPVGPCWPTRPSPTTASSCTSTASSSTTSTRSGGPRTCPSTSGPPACR